MLAAVVRVIRLAEPRTLVFDETYYAKDACLYLGNLPESCDLTQATEQTYVHPPLGKWLISPGIEVFGYDSFGWRISAVVFGVALVLVAYLLAERLFRSRWTALVSALLVATDFLLFVQSRVAMLDIFLAFFVAVGFLFVAIDRDNAHAIKDSVESQSRGRPPRRAEYRLGAGLAFGLALAVKWSAVYALAAGAVMCFLWTAGIVRRRRTVAGDERANGVVLLKDVLFTGIAFGLVPLVVYLVSYADWFSRQAGMDCPYTVPSASDGRFFGAGFYGLSEGECIQGLPGVALSFGDLQDRMADYHLNLKATHPYQSKAWTWPLVLRPVAYFYEGETGRSVEIIGIANVATWYAALLAAGWLVIRSRRSWTPERMVLAAWASQYLPWLLVARPLFFFYMTPVVPFMMIGLAAALNALRHKGRFGRPLVVGFLVLGVGVMFAIFYPILTAIEIDYDLWRRLMWIPQFECGGLQCGWI
ncbi:MAG TPA: phospholipid carrier-dependent glycosyltransferase [Actinomycetota bacterium]|nr:phospholipid carrier-dependent glycosyltransferase [Actinomycetota bacterium]